MSGMSRRKGKSGEREVAALIRESTGFDCQRRVRQHDGDSDLLGVPGWSIEVKRYGQVGRADIIKWYRQAVEQAKSEGERPVLFYRRDKDSWRAVWPLRLSEPESWGSYIYTVEGTVEAWATVVEENNNDSSRMGWSPVSSRQDDVQRIVEAQSHQAASD